MTGNSYKQNSSVTEKMTDIDLLMFFFPFIYLFWAVADAERDRWVGLD